MSAHTLDKLAYMAGQIARNLAHEPDPPRAAADHIRQFWTPGMIAALKSADASLPAQVRAVASLL